MNTLTSCQWIITLSLVSTVPVLGADQACAQSGSSVGGGSESIGSSPGASHGMSKPGTSKNIHPDGTTRSMGPKSNQTQNQTPPERMQALENRLREGHMDQPVAQGQISDRLDQFYRDPENVSGDTAAGPSRR